MHVYILAFLISKNNKKIPRLKISLGDDKQNEKVC